MVPSAKDIIRWRYLLTVALRVISLLVIPLGFIRLGSWMIEGVSDDDLFMMSYYADRIAGGLTFVILGAVGLAAAGLVAQLLIPMPTARCPRCAYRLIGLRRPVCPECGQTVPEEFVDPAPPQGAAPPRPAAAATALPPILTIDPAARKPEPAAKPD